MPLSDYATPFSPQASTPPLTYCQSTLSEIHLFQLGPMPYLTTLKAMQHFTKVRKPPHADQIWITEHPPCYTLHPKKPKDHILHTLPHPLYPTDRGGDITFHGPGQLILYCLMDLRRAPLKLKGLVTALEMLIVATLADFGIEAYANPNARGVYVGQKKFASVGLKIAEGCAYHGIALNVDPDLKAFQAIHPCGLQHIGMGALKQTIAYRTLRLKILYVLRGNIHNIFSSFNILAPNTTQCADITDHSTLAHQADY